MYTFFWHCVCVWPKVKFIRLTAVREKTILTDISSVWWGNVSGGWFIHFWGSRSYSLRQDFQSEEQTVSGQYVWPNHVRLVNTVRPGSCSQSDFLITELFAHVNYLLEQSINFIWELLVQMSRLLAQINWIEKMSWIEVNFSYLNWFSVFLVSDFLEKTGNSYLCFSCMSAYGTRLFTPTGKQPNQRQDFGANGRAPNIIYLKSILPFCLY